MIFVIMDTDLSTPTVNKFALLAVVPQWDIGIAKINALPKEHGPTEETVFSIPVKLKKIETSQTPIPMLLLHQEAIPPLWLSTPFSSLLSLFSSEESVL